MQDSSNLIELNVHNKRTLMDAELLGELIKIGKLEAQAIDIAKRISIAEKLSKPTEQLNRSLQLVIEKMETKTHKNLDRQSVWLNHKRI